MATTIDKLDISVYNIYAVRTRMVEQINQDLHLDQASSIPPQIQLMNTYAQLSEMEILWGVSSVLTPWAYFLPPQQFRMQRRPLFSSSRVAPSLNILDEENQEFQALDTINCGTEEERVEKEKLKDCLQIISKLNRWMGFITGRIGQFLQG